MWTQHRCKFFVSSKKKNMELEHEHSVLRSVSVVSGMTAISRVLGLVREIAMAYFFGTSALKSAFDIAFIIPNLFRRLFGEGALSSAFVPVFSECLVKQGRERAFHLSAHVISFLVLVLGCVTVLGVVLTYPLAAWLPEGSRWLLPLPMLRIMLPYALLICIAALLSGMLNALGRFAISALTPFLLNVIWIATLFMVAPFFFHAPEGQILILSWAILFAGLAQILFQLPALSGFGFHCRLRFQSLLADKDMRRVLSLMGPAALGIGLIQVNVCVDKFLAFWADPAAPAALEYAERLIYLPLGMFGTAFMTVLLPTFSRQASANDLEALRTTLERAMRNLIVIMAPCSAGLLVLALPVINFVYAMKGGRFDQESAMLSARALAAYAPGLLIFSFQKALTPAFYGLQDLKTPVRISLFALLLNLMLNISSVLILPHGWKHVGIAGSTVVTSLANSIVLGIFLHRRVRAPRIFAFGKTVCKAVTCAFIMAFVSKMVWMLGTRYIAEIGYESKLTEALVMMLTLLVGGGVYGGLMLIVGKREMREMLGEFRHGRRVKGSVK